MIRVAVVEDDKATRKVLCDVLTRETDIQLIGDYSNAEVALSKLPTLAPNVVLMDVNLPGMNGVECAGRLASVSPATQIVMLTVFEDTDVIFQSLAAGASGYLLKPVRPADLLAAVRDVIAGGAPMTSNIARKVVQSFQSPRTAMNEPATPTEPALSPREREVLDYLARGYLYKEIAKQLGVSYSTVHTHIERIYQKLHVRSRAQAIAKVYTRLPPERDRNA